MPNAKTVMTLIKIASSLNVYDALISCSLHDPTTDISILPMYLGNRSFVSSSSCQLPFSAGDEAAEPIVSVAAVELNRQVLDSCVEPFA